MIGSWEGGKRKRGREKKGSKRGDWEEGEEEEREKVADYAGLNFSKLFQSESR